MHGGAGSHIPLTSSRLSSEMRLRPLPGNLTCKQRYSQHGLRPVTRLLTSKLDVTEPQRPLTTDSPREAEPYGE